MRVIAGKAKGHRLRGPRSRRDRAAVTRPSSDLVRGAIFAALGSLGVDLSRVLDLYAGSGALGIEALSRGAQWCDFVERDPAACAVIKANLSATGFDGQSAVHCLPAERAADRLQGVYTLVLADPPYADPGALSVLRSLAGSQLVEADRTVVVVEHSSREEPPQGLGTMALQSRRRHGDSAVSIYR